jgi:hypothetical protein
MRARHRDARRGLGDLPFRGMSQSDSELRKELLDALAEAADDLALALASLTAAYEQLDDQQAEALEEQLFRPLQHAYGRAKRTHSEFAARHRLPARTFATPSPGAPSQGVKAFVEHAITAVGHAESELVALQDSLKPIEVGDVELRAGLSEIRRLIDPLPSRALEFVRRFGR